MKQRSAELLLALIIIALVILEGLFLKTDYIKTIGLILLVVAVGGK